MCSAISLALFKFL